VSEAVLHHYFPFEAPPGAHSTIPRWRQMAALWCASGVVRPELSPVPEPNPLQTRWTGTEYVVNPGACWVHGFYGVSDSLKHVPGGPESGLVVARYRPELESIQLVYRPGVSPGGEIKDENGWWEIPLAQMNTDGSVTDIRRIVPLPHVVPPVTEVPATTPKGWRGWYAEGPGSQIDVSAETNVVVWYGQGAIEPGRDYRFTFLSSGQQLSTGPLPNSRVDCWVRDDLGERRRETLVFNHQDADAMPGRQRGTQFVLRGLVSNVVAVITSYVSGTGNLWRWPASSAKVEVEDMGASS
jgi:hypothetical protein